MLRQACPQTAHSVRDVIGQHEQHVDGFVGDPAQVGHATSDLSMSVRKVVLDGVVQQVPDVLGSLHSEARVHLGVALVRLHVARCQAERQPLQIIVFLIPVDGNSG